MCILTALWSPTANAKSGCLFEKTPYNKEESGAIPNSFYNRTMFNLSDFLESLHVGRGACPQAPYTVQCYSAMYWRLGDKSPSQPQDNGIICKNNP